MAAVRLGRRSLLIIVLVSFAAIGSAFTWNAIARPGCSLLPVALPDAESAARPGTSEQACAVLGRPLPDAAVLPPGVRRSEIAIGGPPPPGLSCCRFVYVTFASSGRNVVLMSIHRGDGIPTGNIGEVNGTVAGVPAIVGQRRLNSMDVDDVSYLWARDGLLFSVRVALANGITRQAADELAASIR
jgi:hypothetical protein